MVDMIDTPPGYRPADLLVAWGRAGASLRGIARDVNRSDDERPNADTAGARGRG
jgi:hypothetical protein